MKRTRLWHRLEQDLRDAVLSGLYPAGTRLPTEAELSDRYGVCRHTVRRALAELASAGLVRALRGSGVWVRGPRLVLPVAALLTGHGLPAGTELCRGAVRRDCGPADDSEAARLRCAPGAMLQRRETVLEGAQGPLALLRESVPAEGPCPQDATAIAPQDWQIDVETGAAAEAARLGIASQRPLLRARAAVEPGPVLVEVWAEPCRVSLLVPGTAPRSGEAGAPGRDLARSGPPALHPV